jgi:hypothetical protein
VYRRGFIEIGLRSGLAQTCRRHFAFRWLAGWRIGGLGSAAPADGRGHKAAATRHRLEQAAARNGKSTHGLRFRWFDDARHNEIGFVDGWMEEVSCWYFSFLG